MKWLFENITVRYDPGIRTVSGETPHPQKAVFKLWERPKLQWSTTTNFTLNLPEGETLPELCFNIVAGKPQPVVDIVKLDNSQQSTGPGHPIKMYRKQHSRSSCLTSPPLSLNASGEYRLEAHNCLPPSSLPLNFTIQVQHYEMPAITILSVQSGRHLRHNNHTNVGTISASILHDVIIHYNISGNPEPKIIWEHNEQILKQNYHVQYNSTHLYISNLSVSDLGWYKAVAFNVLGNVSSEIHVIDPASSSTHIPVSGSMPSMTHVTNSKQSPTTTVIQVVHSDMFQTDSQSEDNQPYPSSMPTNTSTNPLHSHINTAFCCSNSSEATPKSSAFFYCRQYIYGDFAVTNYSL
jgi:hypothetical protein